MCVYTLQRLKAEFIGEKSCNMGNLQMITSWFKAEVMAVARIDEPQSGKMTDNWKKVSESHVCI